MRPVMFKIRKKGESGHISRGLKMLSESKRYIIKNLFTIILLLLTASIILIFLRLVLAAGVTLIAVCALEILLLQQFLRQTRALENTIEEISELNEKTGDVISRFSHHIREPLNNLVVVGEMLASSELSKKQKDLVETLIASTNNMADILNDLTVQSAVASYEERKQIRFNIGAAIENTIDLFRLKSPQNIDFILHKKDAANFEVTGDPIILKQIFLDIFNIISEQSREFLTKVTTSIKKEKEKDRECIVSFRIQTDRRIIFLDDRNATSNHMIKLISSGGGNYTQELSENYSVFTFTLKFVSIAEEKKKPIASPAIEALRVKEKHKKELKDANILLVEDNPINQKITLLTLKPLVNSIDTASDGREALEKFGSSSYDLILMDIQMPVMSGIIAAEKIRALEASTSRHTPIIAITANAMLGDKERCLAAGMDDYISKPFQPSSLIDIIKKHL